MARDNVRNFGLIWGDKTLVGANTWTVDTTSKYLGEGESNWGDAQNIWPDPSVVDSGGHRVQTAAARHIVPNANG